MLKKWEKSLARIGTVRYNWPMSAHASQAFNIAHCTDSEDLPRQLANIWYINKNQKKSPFKM